MKTRTVVAIQSFTISMIIGIAASLILQWLTKIPAWSLAGGWFVGSLMVIINSIRKDRNEIKV